MIAFSGGVTPTGADLELIELELENISYTSEHDVSLEGDRQQRRAALKQYVEGFSIPPLLSYHLGGLIPPDTFERISSPFAVFPFACHLC